MAVDLDDWTTWLELHIATLILLARQWVPGHADAEDVVQEAFIRFGDHGIVSDPAAYFYACVKHVVLDWRRNRYGRSSPAGHSSSGGRDVVLRSDRAGRTPCRHRGSPEQPARDSARGAGSPRGREAKAPERPNRRLPLDNTLTSDPSRPAQVRERSRPSSCPPNPSMRYCHAAVFWR